MEEPYGEDSEPDLVLAVVPPLRRRLPWPVPLPPAAVPVSVAVATVAPAPVPASAPPEVPCPPPRPSCAPPVSPRAAVDAPAEAAFVRAAISDAGAEPDDAARWPDRRWWTSTAASTVVHIVLLTILALIATVPERRSRPRPLRLGQPADEAAPEEFPEPEEFAEVAIVPPDPVVEPVAAEAVPVDIDVAADAEAAAFEEPDIAVAAVNIDAEGLVARIAVGAIAAAGAGAGAGPGAGFGGDVGRRLAAAGAKTGDVQVSLSWDNFNDIDLHVVAPSGERIFFGHRVSWCRGTLDVDMNALGPHSREPVENVFWPEKGAPPGEYRVFVHHYWRFDPNHDETTFTVHVLVDGQKRRFTGSVKFGDAPVAVTAFSKARGNDAGVATAAAASDEFVE